MSQPLTVREKFTVLAELIEELVVALVNVRTFAPGHQELQEQRNRTWELLATILAGNEDNSVKLVIVDNVFHFQETPMVAASANSSSLMGRIRSWGGEGLEFCQGTTVEDLKRLVRFLASGSNLDEHVTQANSKLAAMGCQMIRLLAREHVPKIKKAAKAPTALVVYQGLVSYLQTANIHVSGDDQVQVSLGRNHVELALDCLEKHPYELMNLARYEQFDPLGLGHSVRVCLLSLNFAKYHIKQRKEVITAGLAGLVHDIGYARVPFECLRNSGQLTSQQQREMEKHPVHGARILAQADVIEPALVAAAFGHHRCPGTGKGYPKIAYPCPQAKITELIRVCDIYEALTGPRLHRDPVSPLHAYQILLGMGDQVDRGVLRRFIGSNGFFPVGFSVMLNNGKSAQVVRQSKSPECPLVTVVGDEGQELVATGRGPESIVVESLAADS